MRASRHCKCVGERARETRLSVIPPEYVHADLWSLRPKSERHHRQADILLKLRNEPNRGYYFGGRNGAGKTLFAWALYRHQVVSGQKAVAVTLRSLLDAFQREATGSDGPPPVISSQVLSRGKRYTVFLDEIEKSRPSEFAAERFFDLIDAVYKHGHQLIVTSNLSPDELSRHWSRNGEFWGPSIVRRVMDVSVFVDLF